MSVFSRPRMKVSGSFHFPSGSLTISPQSLLASLGLWISFTQIPTFFTSSEHEFISLQVPKLSSLELLMVAHHPTLRHSPEIWPLSTSLATFSPLCLVLYPLGTRNSSRVFTLSCLDYFAQDIWSPWYILPLFHEETSQSSLVQLDCHFPLYIQQAGFKQPILGAVFTCYVHLYSRVSSLSYQILRHLLDHLGHGLPEGQVWAFISLWKPGDTSLLPSPAPSVLSLFCYSLTPYASFHKHFFTPASIWI